MKTVAIYLATLAACGPPFALVQSDAPDVAQSSASQATVEADVADATPTTPTSDAGLSDKAAVRPDAALDAAVVAPACNLPYDAAAIAASNCGAVFQGDPPAVYYVGFTYSANCTPAPTPDACRGCSYGCGCILDAAGPCGPGIAASCDDLAGAVEILCQPR